MFLLTLFISILSTGHTAEQIIAPAPPVLTRIAGQPVTVLFASGNQAELRVNRNPQVKVFPLPFTLTENLCSAQPSPPTFETRLATRVHRLTWFWVKHSDVSKVGQVVQLSLTSPAPGLPLVDPIFVTNALKFYAPDLVQGLPPDELHFSAVNWLPGLEDGQIKPVRIENWFTERMRKNSETGATENQVVASLNGIHLQPLDPTTFAVAQMDTGVSLEKENHAFLMIGDAVTWIFNRKPQPCQISFKPNLALVEDLANKYVDSLPNIYVPYRWQEDGLTSQVNAFMFSTLIFVE